MDISYYRKYVSSMATLAINNLKTRLCPAGVSVSKMIVTDVVHNGSVLINWCIYSRKAATLNDEIK